MQRGYKFLDWLICSYQLEGTRLMSIMERKKPLGAFWYDCHEWAPSISLELKLAVIKWKLLGEPEE